jgi:hypothetical protein
VQRRYAATVNFARKAGDLEALDALQGARWRRLGAWR